MSPSLIYVLLCLVGVQADINIVDSVIVGNPEGKFDVNSKRWPQEKCATAIQISKVDNKQEVVESTSAGSCYGAGGGHGIECNVDEAACGAKYYPPGFISTRNGCCHCGASCDHATETGTECSYNDAVDEVAPKEPESAGSCYGAGGGHGIECNMDEAACDAKYYPPGFISTRNGCCHCDASCDHATETGTECSYNDAAGDEAAGEETGETGTCQYNEVCCCSDKDGVDCVLFDAKYVGHQDNALERCPTSEMGSPGVYMHLMDERKGRANGPCGDMAYGVEWSYTDGSSTKPDKMGNTGCQMSGSCAYSGESCCYNTWGDHRCFIYSGLPTIDRPSHQMMSGKPLGPENSNCPMPPSEKGWAYPVPENDGRNNGCCEDMVDISPSTFRGDAMDGRQCFVTDRAHTTCMSDCSLHTGLWVGFHDGETNHKTEIFKDVAAAEAAGCHIGDWPEKFPNGDVNECACSSTSNIISGAVTFADEIFDAKVHDTPEFKKQCQTAIAEALKAPIKAVVITKVKSGSVIVEYTVDSSQVEGTLDFGAAAALKYDAIELIEISGGNSAIKLSKLSAASAVALLTLTGVLAY